MMSNQKPTVRVRIVGGLGNQMFGAAAGIALARRLGATLEFEWYKYPANATETRPYELGPFNLGVKLWYAKDWRFKREAALYRAWKRWTATPGEPLPVAWRQEGHHFDPAFDRLSGNVYITGYFQSWRYFADAESEIRKTFDLKPIISPTGRLFAAAAAAAGENSVAVHLRRGDYAQHAERFVLLQQDYYQRAIGLISRAVDRPQFFVVSDDGGAARELFADWPDATFAEGTTAFDDMHLIASCRHHVIANSSFSWWGAWLSPQLDGLTIAPRAWFSRAISLQTFTDDTYPQGWFLT